MGCDLWTWVMDGKPTIFQEMKPYMKIHSKE